MPFVTQDEWNQLVTNKKQWDALREQLNRIEQQGQFNERMLRQLSSQLGRSIIQDQQQGINIMKTLDDVISDITDLSSKEDGLITLTSGIKAQLDAVTQGSLTPEQQAKVDAIFAAVEDRKTTVQAAIDANTPPASPPPAAPAPAPTA